MEGRFIQKIARTGHGPGEYIQLDFFDIDRENNHIVLTDLMSYWIMRYDLDGTFLFRQKIPVWCEGVSLLKNKGVVLYANFRNNSRTLEQEYNLIYLDSAMNIKKVYFPYRSKDVIQGPPASMRGQFFAINENTNFTFPGGNTVYQITGDSLINKHQFDFGKKILNVENMTDPHQFAEYLKNNEYNGFISAVMENDKYLFFLMRTDVYPFPLTVFYSKDSGNILSTYLFSFDKLFYFTNFLQTGYGEWIISEIQSHDLIRAKENFLKNLKYNPKSQLSRHSKELLSLAEELTEDDNPVLMFYKLKPF
jgi:hypothetical protein